MKEENDKDKIKEWARVTIIGKSYNSVIGDIHITMKGIKEALNQPHADYHEKNKAIYNLPELLRLATNVKTADDTKGKVKQYHYLEILVNGKSSYMVIKETWEETMSFYSIVDKIKNG